MCPAQCWQPTAPQDLQRGTSQRVVTIQAPAGWKRDLRGAMELHFIVVSELISFVQILGNHCEGGTKKKQ